MRDNSRLANIRVIWHIVTLRASGGIGRRAGLKIRDMMWVRVPPRPQELSSSIHAEVMHAVIDTSPLQAFWRTETLEILGQYFESLTVARAVADETRNSYELKGPEKVPDLDRHSWILVQDVSKEELYAAMETVFRSYQLRFGPKWKKKDPSIEIQEGRITAWTTREHRRSIDVPDLATAVLAQRTGSIAILDDSAALDIAILLGVTTATSLEVAAVLAQTPRLDLESFKTTLERKGYNPLHRTRYKWGGPV